jgi:hypothetical protein
MVAEDNELRNHLYKKTNYDEFKRNQRTMLSNSKHSLVEKSLQKRYDIDGMERIRPFN